MLTSRAQDLLRETSAPIEAPKGSERALYLDTPPFEEWCQYVEILPKLGGKVSFAQERWGFEQRQLNANRTGKDLVVKPRQVWVSTLELARDLHTPLKVPGTHTLVVVHDERSARVFHAVVSMMMQSLERHRRLPPVATDRVGEIIFSGTGSTLRIVEAGATEHTAEKKGRSQALYRLHGSELAFWRQAATTLQAARGGSPVEEIFESTTNGASGAFYDLVQAARKDSGEYKLHFFAWWQHEEYRRATLPDFDPTPRDEWEERLRAHGCDDEQIAWWRAKVDDPTQGLERTLEEFPIDIDTAFRAAGGQYIDATTCDWLGAQVRAPLRRFMVRRAGEKQQPQAAPLEPGQVAPKGAIVVRIYDEPQAGELYLIGGDVAEGIGKDAHAGDVANRRTGLTVATLWSDSADPGDFGHALAIVGRMYNTALVAPERNKDGATVIRALTHEANYPNVYRHKPYPLRGIEGDDRLGWPTTPATRPPLFDEQADMWRGRGQPTPDALVAAEARTLARGDDGKPRARGKGTAGGAKDDAYVARAIATQVWLRERVSQTGRSRVRDAAVPESAAWDDAY